jgi:hypothetical protein
LFWGSLGIVHDTTCKVEIARVAWMFSKAHIVGIDIYN